MTSFRSSIVFMTMVVALFACLQFGCSNKPTDSKIDPIKVANDSLGRQM